MIKVIRVVQYEGTEEAVREAIAKSLPLGERDCRGYTITIAEHLNELPKQIELSNEEIKRALEN